ncbi:MAG: hypothetical protein QOI38_586, partial [Sphingomonadales bacterium]|nr:hypothetical protein [Sphingomonadales bacterium]
LVRDVVYAPRRSLEIEEVGAFATDALPAGATRSARCWLAEALERIRRA